MPDVFDEIETTGAGGDLFDQVAASAPQKGIFERALSNLPQSLMRAISNAPGAPIKQPAGPTKTKTLKGFGGKSIEFQDIQPPSPMEELKGVGAGLKEAFNPATAPERFAEDPAGTVLVPASIMAGAARGIASSPRLRAAGREAIAEAKAPTQPSVSVKGLGKVQLDTHVPRALAYGATGAATGHAYFGAPGAVIGGVGGAAVPFVRGAVRGFRSAAEEADAARAAQLANMESQINWKPPSPPPQIIEATTESVAPAQPLVSLDELAKGYGFKSFEKAPPADQAKLMAAHNALVRKSAPPPPPPSPAPAEAYGGTVRNGVIYDEQGAPPKEAKPPMPSRTEGAPTQTQPEGILREHKKVGEERVNIHTENKNEFIINYMRSRGKTMEDFAKDPNRWITEVNEYRRKISNPTEYAKEGLKNKKQQLSQYKPYDMSDADSRRSLEVLLKAPEYQKLWKSKGEWVPVPPPPN